jgi:hypothetical protein
MSADAPPSGPEQVLSAQQVAEHYQISVAHVMYLALWRSIGRDIGDGRLVFSPADIETLRPRESEQAWRTRSERMLDPDQQDPTPARRVWSILT